MNKLLIISMGWTIIGLLGCNSKEQVPDPPMVLMQANEIVLTPAQVERVGIATTRPEEKQLSDLIHANGMIDVPPQNKAKINAWLPGYIKKANLLPGERVTRGQVMAVLENPEYLEAQQTYLELKESTGFLKAEYERYKVLVEENIVAKKQFLKAKADYKAAWARLKGVKRELQVMGLDTNAVAGGNFTTTIQIKAPISGYISTAHTEIGKWVDAKEVLYEIVNHDHIHLELKVFEKDMLKIKEGQKILFSVTGTGEEVYEGEVYLIGKVIESPQRTVNVHGHISRERHVLIPGMYIEASVVTGTTKVWAVPEQAVVRAGEEAYVFLASGKSDKGMKFQYVPVSTGLESEGWTEITNWEEMGTDPQVVIKGNFFLLSAMEQEG